MRKNVLSVLTRWVMGAVFVLFSSWALAGLDQLVQKTDKNAIMGVLVKDVSTGRVIYQHNADHLFIPASSLKIFTAAAALIMLGPNYQFDTGVYTDARFITSGVLNGNLYVTFSGDPTLTSSDVVDVLSILKTKGITKIKGNIILVYPNYTGEKYPPGVVAGDKLHPYGAPITPVIIDQNATTFIISPTRPGQLANVSASDSSHRINVINALYTKRPGTKGCSLSYHLDEQNQLFVRGCIAPRGSSYVERIPLVNPSSYAQGVVNVGLQHWGVSFQGHITPGQMPSSAKQLNVHRSDALPVILANTLKPSNNVFANALYLKVGLTYWRQLATWQNSGLAIKQILEKYAGVPMQNATMVDGAGLSRQNRVSPIQAVTLLANMEHKFMLSDDYISAFPVPGEKGTLVRWRIAPQKQQARIHAKTGTMKGIVGLSGYMMSANNHPLVFSIMTNSTSSQISFSDRVALASWKYRELEGNICQYLMKTSV